MDKFYLPSGGKDKDSINRTIRWRGDLYDKLLELSQKHKVSFNHIVNEAVQFALDHFDEGERGQG